MTRNCQLLGGRDDGTWVTLAVGITTFQADSGNLYNMRQDGLFYHELCKWDDLPPMVIGAYS